MKEVDTNWLDTKIQITLSRSRQTKYFHELIVVLMDSCGLIPIYQWKSSLMSSP